MYKHQLTGRHAAVELQLITCEINVKVADDSYLLSVTVCLTDCCGKLTCLISCYVCKHSLVYHVW